MHNQKVGAYNATINDDATAIIRARTEAAHKAKRADCATYETARRETAQFILAIVDDNWVRELRNTDTLYTNVTPRALLDHLQVECTGCHALNLLALHNKIQRYHLKVKGIPEYINILKDAQKQAGRDGCTITDEMRLLFASTAMLTAKMFLRKNKDWEDRAEANKTWAKWKAAYKREHEKAQVKAQANEVLSS